MMIGNGLTSYQWDCIPAFLDMAVYHNLLDDELHARLKESCTWKDLMVKATPLGNATCDAYFDLWMTSIDKLNIYNIYAPCVQNQAPQLTLRDSATDSSVKRRGYTDWLTLNRGLSNYGKGLP